MFVFVMTTLLFADLPLVVVDPGHGGEHNGAIGICGVAEKNVTLSIAKELAQVLNQSGRARALLTRESDQTVELKERANLANLAQAALFISVHANAAIHESARGLETFFLSRKAADRRIANLARLENDGQKEEESENQHALTRVLDGLRLQAVHSESQQFAMRVQDTMNRKQNQYGRGVLQAPFIVLRQAAMPAVLVEVGFLSNKTECQKLATLDYQRQVAHSLAAAILAHLAYLDKTSQVTQASIR